MLALFLKFISASDSAENRRFRLLHCRLMPPVQGTHSLEYPQNCEKLASLGFIFATDSVGVYSFKFSL